MGVESALDLKAGLVIWLIVIAAIVLIQWARKAGGVGLVLAYLAILWLYHWPGAFIYLLPWHVARQQPFLPPDNFLVKAGFEQAVYAAVSFGVGAIFLAPILLRFLEPPRAPMASEETVSATPNPRLPKLYMLIGVFSYLVLDPLLGRLPTVTALVSTANHLLVVGLCLAWWQAWQANNRRAQGMWLIAGTSIPFFTLAVRGFLVHGLAGATTVFAFVLKFFRPRWLLVILACLIAFLGLSIYVSYMRDRPEIRRVLWSNPPLSQKIERIYQTASTLEWFDIHNRSHLRYIDDRLNRNILGGATVYYLSSGYQDYARGKTIWWSIQALVPRVLWPDKPIVAGGSNLAGTYTGISFSGGTSVAVGLVMEFYLNFGTVGVVVGCLLLGGLIGLLDMMAAHHLQRGDWKRFALWFLPGIAVISGAALLEITASAGGAIITALLVNRLLHHFGEEKMSNQHRSASPIH